VTVERTARTLGGDGDVDDGGRPLVAAADRGTIACPRGLEPVGLEAGRDIVVGTDTEPIAARDTTTAGTAVDGADRGAMA